MGQIVLIRPGSTEFSASGRVQGNLDIPLSQVGIAEVAQVAAELVGHGIEAVYSPGGEPAQQTAEAIAQVLSVKVKKLERMQNLNHGLWQGMLIEEIKRKHPKVYRQWQEQPHSVTLPDGETLGDAQARVERAMKKLVKRHRGDIVAVVAPEPLATLIHAYLGSGEVGDLWQAPSEHGSWEILETEPQKNSAPSV